MKLIVFGMMNFILDRQTYCWSLRIALFLILVAFETSAQQLTPKREIDSNDFFKWPALEQPAISPNGNFVMYLIKNSPVGSSTMVVKSTKSNWEKRIVSQSFSYFNVLTNRHALINDDRGVNIITLEGDMKLYPGYFGAVCSDLQETGVVTMGNYKTNKMLLINGKRNLELSGVNSYQFVAKNSYLLIESATVDESMQLKLVDVNTFSTKEILKGNILQVKLNQAKDKLACLYTDNENSGKVRRDLYYIDLHHFGNISLSDGKPPKYEIADIVGFNSSDECLIVKVKSIFNSALEKDAVELRLWGYHDERSKLADPPSVENCTLYASVSLKDMTLKILEEARDVFNGNLTERINYTLVGQTQGDCYWLESFWNPACNQDYFLLDIHTGIRKYLPKLSGRNLENKYHLSPDEQFVVFYDLDQKSWFSYDTKRDRLHNLVKSGTGNFGVERDRLAKKGYIPTPLRGLAGWIATDSTVLLYDDNDILSADLTGKRPLGNITKGYGLKTGIRFFMPNSRDGIFTYGKNSKVILTAVDLSTMDNGFYALKLGSYQPPEKLTMGNFVYYMPNRVNDLGGIAPIKAEYANMYILQRGSATDFPNYFVTSDFKKITPVSDIHPEKDYKLPRTELHTYFTPDGEELKGILYKPADFDPEKKYPIIFNYYETVSPSLNDFVVPSALCGSCNINYPLMVSKGYIVFRPDMRFKFDEAAKSALNCLMAAVKHLSNFKWVDTANMGLQGCSFGGYETNYFIANSNIFKAASSAAGASDILGMASVLYKTMYTSFTFQQLRMSTMPWENPRLFTDASPFYNVNNVNTPLLLMHTSVDDAVPFGQGVQLFNALRKLKKPTWLLEYSGESANHGLRDPKQQIDFSTRMLQFFDHYLMAKPAPTWMLKNNSQ